MDGAHTWLYTQWTTYPRIALALRAATAAALAWILVWFVPGAGDYPYYAPFGAVIATTFTLAGSVRESLQAVGSIVAGGTVAWLIDAGTHGVPTPLTVGVVVALSVGIAGWRGFGAMGGWAPTAEIFTLIIGHGDAQFIGAYGGLTLFGALIGIVINTLTPPLPLAPARMAVDHARKVLAGQLRELGELMVEHELPTPEQWHREHSELGHARADMQEALSRAHESLAGNARARSHRAALDTLSLEAESLDRVSLLASDLSDLVLRPHSVPGEPSLEAALTDTMRGPIATAIHLVADALEAYRQGSGVDPPLAAADAELYRLLEFQPSRTPEQLMVHSVVLALRRALDAFS